MLYLISLGIGRHSISYLGLKVAKKCDELYLETYTSVMEESKEELETFLNKKIIEIDRNFVEKEIYPLFQKSKDKNIGILVKGDSFSATTHIDIYLKAKKENIPIKVIPGVSILTIIGITGLSLYQFGKTTSIPFDNKDIKSAYEAFLVNQKNNLHTLFLLDLDPKNNKFLEIREACEYLTNNGTDKNLTAIGCARLGFENFKIKTGTIESLKREDFGKPPYCLIIPGKLHFIEEEALGSWK